MSMIPCYIQGHRPFEFIRSAVISLGRAKNEARAMSTGSGLGATVSELLYSSSTFMILKFTGLLPQAGASYSPAAIYLRNTPVVDVTHVYNV